MRYHIRNVDVLTPRGVEEGSGILIDGRRIAAVGPDLSPDNALEIDGKGMLAMPGLVNTHTHVAMTLFRSYADDVALMDWLQNHIWPAEEKLDAEMVYWGSQLAFAEMIRGGTTAFCDMYMFADAIARAAIDVGMRGNIARGIAGVAPNGESALAENVELFHQWHQEGNGLLRIMLGPHAPYTCPPAFLEKVVDVAAKENMEIHIHLSETKGEVDTCREKHGLSPIALMEKLGVFDHPTLAAHCVHVDKDDIAILANKKVRVAHNPRSNLKLASGIAPVPEMLRQGVTVGLATDGASSNNKLDMFAELQYAALIHKGNELDPFAIDAKTAVRLATEEGGKVLGYDDLGVLAEGYLADLILVDRSGLHWQPEYNTISQLAYAAHSLDVDSVFINGKPLMRNKELLTIDVERVKKEVRKYRDFFADLQS